MAAAWCSCPKTEMEKVVFLDRDGVINEKAAPHEYITSWDKFRFLPHTAQAIRLLNEAGYKTVIVSNQRGVARGRMTMQQVDDLHAKMCAMLAGQGAHIDAIYVCPHGEGECHCRKPEIGLFLQAEEAFEVDKARSWMIGDSASDILAGERYGVRTILVNSAEKLGSIQCADLLAAAEYIVGEERK